jgi:hypothetical protein
MRTVKPERPDSVAESLCSPLFLYLLVGSGNITKKKMMLGMDMKAAVEDGREQKNRH